MSTTPRRHHAPRRAAALTAATVGAALLAFPGAASAQEVDCDTIGANPKRPSLSQALDVAVACDTEVRIHTRALPYATVYATPEGRLHLVATGGPDQEYWDLGQADPTLVVKDGRLDQTLSQWPYSLAYDAPDAPLLATQHAVLDWTGTVPQPTYSGTEARYDELAPGLDLAADMDVASVGLTFTAADAAAWDALATGITAAPRYWNPDRSIETDGSVLTFVDRLLHEDLDINRSTPFTVRDAAGTVTPAELSLGDDGALTIGLHEGALDDAAFPVALSTQWTSREPAITEWGAATSAAPGLAAFRGEAGLDAPYFEAAGETGTALVGAYCDDLADPACAEESQAAAYWRFGTFDFDTPVWWPSLDYDYAYPLVSAEFNVDAAAGTDCVAPDAHLATGFGPETTWAAPPAPVDAPAVAGTCQDGTATYDLTDAVRTADAALDGTVTVAMDDSAETARFDGGSGRLDVYYDIVGTNLSRFCAEDPANPDVQDTATPEYGGVMLDVWRHEDTGLGLTMTASFTDTATGETVLTTDPQPIAAEGPEGGTVDPEDALPDGAYEVVMAFTTADGVHTFTDVPCYLTVDTSATYDDRDYDGDGYQDLLSIRRSDGQLLFSAGEGDFTFAPAVAEGGGWAAFDVTMAGDVTFDGRPDLIARDNRTGTLYTYPGDGTGGFGTRISLGGGWNAMGAITSAGDFNGDGFRDLLAVRRTDGRLTAYTGRGDGTFRTGSELGTGWGAMDALTVPGDVNRDGHYDLLAHDSRTGEYRVYFGDGAFGFTPAAVLPATFDGEGGERFDQITAAGDQNGDGLEDLLAVNSATGQLVSLSLDTDGTAWGAGHSVDWPWDDKRLPTIAPDGTYDYTGDGKTDVLARNGTTGTTYAYPGNGTGGFGTAVTIGTQFSGMNLLETAGDLNGDTRSDVLARTTGGDLYLYPGNGTGGLGTRIHLGGGWNAFNALIGGQDFNGDGTADLLARDTATGVLYLYAAAGDGTLHSRTEFGTGWNAASLITAAGDLDHDGKADVLARKNADNCLYFYAGTGGGLRNGVQIGCGWDVMNTVAAVGDFNGDGHTDWAARHTNGSLYLYRGNGAGSYSSSAVIGTGWGGMNPVL